MQKRKTRSLRERLRAIEADIKTIRGLVPYMKDAILVMALLLEKGVVTREEIDSKYQKLV